MRLHPSTFQYLKPSPEQVEKMATVRDAFAEFVGFLNTELPEGADKTVVIRKIREAGMWANVTITREADGTPRPGAQV